MSYQGLARKWRPQVFADLVGQEHIAVTLTNAIVKGRISHGYLFTGTRGIGKTSAARIFAKALRCKNPSSPGVPCGKCQDCIEITESRSMDVIEIDGASNNGVDNVREIRESVKFLPSSGKYKIYIIDEVHMLTPAAFNALLKTLEEPPAHVHFIFATTDPQKIPETILSRCQRHDFKRVSQKLLAERLKDICKTEKLTLHDDALAILAREAEGSMRDGISLLDQVCSAGEGKEISVQAIARALGLVDKQTILDCVSGILKRDPLKAIEAVGKVHLHGFDLKHYGREVLRYLRTIMVAKLLCESKPAAEALSQYLDISDIDLADVKALGLERSMDELDMLFGMLNFGLEDVARSAIPKMVMDVLVIKMATALNVLSVSDLKEADVRPSAAIQTASDQTASDITKTITMDLHWWKTVVAYVYNQKPLFGSALEHLGFQNCTQKGEGLLVTLTYSKETSIHRDQLESNVNKELLAQVMKAHLGCAVRLDYVNLDRNTVVNHKSEVRSLVQIEEDERQVLIDLKKKKILESDAMKVTQQLLGATLEKLEVK